MVYSTQRQKLDIFSNWDTNECVDFLQREKNKNRTLIKKKPDTLKGITLLIISTNDSISPLVNQYPATIMSN